MRRVCPTCNGTHRKGAACPHDTSRTREVHLSPDYLAARLVVFARDGYRCYFCGDLCVAGDRHLKPTAAHYPHSVDELVALGLDPTNPSTMVTAHARCHGRVDGARSRS